MNEGKNNGRRLKSALSRFSAMLIEEARDFTGMSYKRLDEALGLEHGQCERYARYPGMKKDRAPQAASIQQLENRIAKLLKRPAHRIIICDVGKELATYAIPGIDDIIGSPQADINLRQYDGSFLQLAYEGNWPTYRRLKCNRALPLYGWQWGILWDRQNPCPYRAQFGFHQHQPVEDCISKLIKFAKRGRLGASLLENSEAGRRLMAIWFDALTAVDSDDLLAEINPILLRCAEYIESCNHLTR